jgi:hypothetical protein
MFKDIGKIFAAGSQLIQLTFLLTSLYFEGSIIFFFDIKDIGLTHKFRWICMPALFSSISTA